MRVFFVVDQIMRVTESLLIGEYRIIQDTERYRFTSDSVCLARFVKAKRGEHVADFCAGSGIVGLHFYAENEGVERVVFFEADEEMAQMSRETISLNGLGEKFGVECCPLQEIPKMYTEAFSLILCNPPYERRGAGFESPDPRKAGCRKELSLTLEELADSAARCLKYGGRLAVIHRADRVSELLCAIHARGLEPKKLQFVTGKAGRRPYAVMVAAVKGGRPGVEVLPEIVNTRGDL